MQPPGSGNLRDTIFQEMKPPSKEADFLVIGAGIAGLRAAIELAQAGRVRVLAKRQVTESNTQYAQGGIAAALSDEDEISLHLQDTLNAGDGLVNPEAARVLVEEGPERIEELIRWGTEFDREGTKLVFAREGAHSRNRVLHAHGDSTGREIQRALYAKAKTLKNISVEEFEFSVDLLTEGKRVCGVTLLTEAGHTEEVRVSAVCLATGGLGQLYRDTTNPRVATGDGVAMAFRAGAEIADMEFIQFHPTALYLEKAPRFLLTEALRGEGAHLLNDQLQPFMSKYHPLAELAPRDVVARAIVHELEISPAKTPVVYLDLTHLDAEAIRKRFPRVHATCLLYNVDITTDMIPIRPAAHYAMGGVRTGLDGRSTIAGLYAAGEVASTGVHGANRLASNSLLEGLVFGARAGRAACGELQTHAAKSSVVTASSSSGKSAPDSSVDTIRHIQEIMTRYVGIVRDGKGLRQALQHLAEIGSHIKDSDTSTAYEARNLHQVGTLVARSALAREESRGGHYRLDFPVHDDVRFLKHTLIHGQKIRFA
jgi:L-aspartate oxidase